MEFSPELRGQLFLSGLPFAILLIGILLFLCWYLKKHGESKELAFYVILLTLVASLPVINDFLISGHDIRFDVDRIENIKLNLLAGKFPVRMNYFSTGNAGVATPSLYPELFLYIPAILRIFNIPPVFALKFLHVLINLACVWFSYYSASKITKSKNIGIIFSALYSLCIFRLENIYLRHALGEALAMCFFPLVILGLYQVLRREHKYWFVLALGITGVIQSHIILTILMALFVVLFCLFNIKHFNKERLLALAKALVLVVGLNMWFFIPYFTYYNLADKSVHMPATLDLAQSSVYLEQLFMPFAVNAYGDNGVRGSIMNEMPLTFGGVIGLGLILFIYFMIIKKGKKTGIQNIGKTFLIYGVIALFPATVFFPWFDVKPLNVFYKIQFAWRFLAIVAPLLALPASIGIYYLLKNFKIKKQLAVLIAVCISITGSIYYISSVNNVETFIFGNDEVAPWSSGDNKYTGSEVSYTHENAGVIKTSEDALQVISSTRNNDVYTIELEYAETGVEEQSIAEQSIQELDPEEPIVKGPYIEVPFYNFPGYTAVYNKKVLPISNGENNFIRVSLPDGFPGGTVKVYYKGLARFIIGNIITLITILGFLGYIFRKQLLVIFSRKGQQAAEGVEEINKGV